MKTKKYSSYAEINDDLRILKAQRKFHYEKMKSSIDKTKHSFDPPKSFSFVGSLYKNMFSGTTRKILTFAVPLLFKWLIKRKRGK